MKPPELLNLLGCPPRDLADFEVGAVTEDSRRAGPGTVFVAVCGDHVDGHVYAEGAVAAGAVAIAGDRSGLETLSGVPYLRVDSPRRAAALLAHALAGNPSKELTVIGITGTNGKSSTACLTQSILKTAGHSAANFGTLGYDLGSEILPALHTTPFGEDLAAMFQCAKTLGISHVVMEVSSHALAQERVAGIDFNAAAFTNLTQDHLDFHGDMTLYREAKLKLFRGIAGEGRFGVVNAEDPAASYFIDASGAPCYRFGKGGDYKAKKIRTGLGGTKFSLKTPRGDADVSMNLLGKHNVSNALCAAAICGGLGVAIEHIVRGLAALPKVPGRFEAVDAGQDFYVIVDYAHTEDGLENVLSAAREMCSGRIITVFGCGGDRDKGKRPKMGAVAGKKSDIALLTSDNPRTEDPHRILLDVEIGLQREGLHKGEGYLVIEDRAEAIRKAIQLAKSGDLVMIAGKGHENYQILGDRRIHFDDCEVARAALAERTL
jgi:UDP-N-acetylmuramoyl-L-alanyl-D-glutamate--2,6-diaminopimelate ligase